jgi:hypothetical protein
VGLRTIGATECARRRAALELDVSTYIGAMPFLWIDVDDEPSPRSLRAYIERNSIALLSNASGRENAR